MQNTYCTLSFYLKHTHTHRWKCSKKATLFILTRGIRDYFSSFISKCPTTDLSFSGPRNEMSKRETLPSFLFFFVFLPFLSPQTRTSAVLSVELTVFCPPNGQLLTGNRALQGYGTKRDMPNGPHPSSTPL